MDGTGREQDLDRPTGHPLPDDARIDGVPETLRTEKGVGDAGDDEKSEPGGGRLNVAEGKQSVRNQSTVSADDYGGSSESGV